MPSLVKCPECGVRLKLSDKPRESITCPKCQTKFKARASGSDAASKGVAPKPNVAPEPKVDSATAQPSHDEDWLDDSQWDDTSGSDHSTDDDWYDQPASDIPLPTRRKPRKRRKKSGNAEQGAGEVTIVPGGIPIRRSIMEREAEKETQPRKKIPGMGILFSVLELATTGPGILIMVGVFATLAVGLPLANLYFQWSEDMGITDGDTERQAQTLANFDALREGVVEISNTLDEDLSDRDMKRKLEDTLDKTRDSIHFNNQKRERDREFFEEELANDRAREAERKRRRAKERAEKEAREKRIAASLEQLQLSDWLHRMPPKEVFVGSDFNFQFAVPVRNVQFAVSDATPDAEVKWAPVQERLEPPRGATKFLLDADMMPHQRLFYVPDRSFEKLESAGLPLKIRVGAEKMTVLELDSYKTAVRIARTTFAFHEVSEPAYITPDSVTDNPGYFNGNRGLLTPKTRLAKAGFSWLPLQKHVGRKHVHLSWRTERGDKISEYTVPVLIKPKAAPDYDNATSLVTLPLEREDIWHPLPEPVERKSKAGKRHRYRPSRTARLVTGPNTDFKATLVWCSPDDPQKLQSNLAFRDGRELIIEMGDENAIPIPELSSDGRVTKVKTARGTRTDLDEILSLPASDPVITVSSITGFIGETQKGPDEVERPGTRPQLRTRILAPAPSEELVCVAADSQTLCRVRASNGQVVDTWKTSQYIADMCHSGEGICLLLREDGARNWERDNRFLTAAARKATSYLESSILVVLDKSFRVKSTYAVYGDAICGSPDSPFVFVSMTATIAAINVSEGVLTGLTPIDFVKISPRSEPDRVDLLLNRSSRHLTAFIKNKSVTWDVSEGRFLNKTTQTGPALLGTPRRDDSLNLCVTPYSKGVAFVSDDESTFTHTHQFLWSRTEEIHTDIDPATRTIVTAARSFYDPFRLAHLEISQGNFSGDFAEFIPDPVAVRNVAPGVFMVLTETQLVLIHAKEKAPAWPFEYETPKYLNVTEPPSRVVIPEEPLQAKSRDSKGRLVGFNYEDIEFESPDESAIFLTRDNLFYLDESTSSTKIMLHRVDADTLKETHRIPWFKNDYQFKSYPTADGILTLDTYHDTVTLLRLDDLTPVWQYSDATFRDIEIIPVENAFSFVDDNGLTVVETATGRILRREGAYERLLQSQADNP